MAACGRLIVTELNFNKLLYVPNSKFAGWIKPLASFVYSAIRILMLKVPVYRKLCGRKALRYTENDEDYTNYKEALNTAPIQIQKTL